MGGPPTAISGAWTEYRRRFRNPLQTAAGRWTERRGWLLRVPGDPPRLAEWVDWPGRPGGGEGSTAFVRWMLTAGEGEEGIVSSAGLLPSGVPEESPAEWARRGYRAVKAKIGGESPEREQRVLAAWWERGEGTILGVRLDANGRLDAAGLRSWLHWMDARPWVEFLEQPFPPGEEEHLRRVAGSAEARLALDESLEVAGALGRWVGEGWGGWWVVKPALCGGTDLLRGLPDWVRSRLILSSAFETGIGFGGVLQLALGLGGDRVHGLGTRGFFGGDGLDGWSPAPFYRAPLGRAEAEALYRRAVGAPV
jgi:O-succinylbenzoate synthase